MKYKWYTSLLVLILVFCASLSAQGLDTSASKTDWEEINFEFNSHILTDGYPSLLRVAELLQQNAGSKVRIAGNTDVIGSTRFNERLGQRRADAVKAFLVKYGARDGQITTATFGESKPKISSRSKEARFINRRVFLTVTDEQGRVVAEGGVSDVMKMLKDMMAAQQKCCDEILKRLDRLDQIADMLQKIVGDEAALRKELGSLRGAHDALDAYVKAQPKPLTEQQTASIVDTRTAEQIERARMPRYSILTANAGADQSGDLTFTGKGRLFLPFKEQFAVQMQGEYMYFRDRQEGQADIGLVNRFATRAQAGIFASFKNVNFSGRTPGNNIFTDRPVSQFTQGQVEGNGTIGQASMVVDYLFSRGRVGVFGSKGFMNNAVLSRSALTANIFNEYYLSLVDQVGVSTTLGLFNNTYMEANAGYLKSKGNADRPGGTIRFIHPLSERFAFTVEGGFNETMLTRDNTGRVVAGFQFGNFMRPKDYLEGYNGVRHAVPVDVPRVRYEVLTRRTRTGNDAPIADAGPDQVGVQPGTITLNGSRSYDPEGDAITFKWEQVAGPAISISGMNTSIATFTAVSGQSYSFRLTVTDDKGAAGIARVTVSTPSANVQQVQIVRFQASPDRIRPGQQSTIDYQVLNADSVTITEIGTVDPKNGSRNVSPVRTTQYRLTARGVSGEASATTTITVEDSPAAQFLTCTASPANILAGESATITYSTSNADTVSISGIGDVAGAGNRVVSPTATTTYTLTATNTRGPVTCQVTVQVMPRGEAPRVVTFAAAPTTITAGQASTLTWSVDNADSVTISSIGTVAARGSSDVRPQTTTTYTLTATNRFGNSQATATVTVNPVVVPPVNPVTIAACTASPATTAKPGDPATISYTIANGTGISISPAVAGASLTGPVQVSPTATTAYTITATGANNSTASCSVTVTVTPLGPPPVAIISGPQVLESIERLLTLDGSQSVNPAGGALTFTWEPLSTGSAVLDNGQAQTRVQIGGAFGDYVFRLTVRNAQGQSDSTTVTVKFISTRFF
jgi:hypothetical protein